MTSRVTLDDFNDVPDLALVHDLETAASSNGRPAVRVVSLDEFVTTVEDVHEPLLGEPDDTALPLGGLLLMYGDGGAGKTTLSVDALAHLAAGQPWLGITVPRPLNVLLIENEGPRGPFRQRLAQKIQAWDGPSFASRVTVLEEPWQLFTLTDPGYRRELAAAIDLNQVDLVIVGPLASLGAKGTGTPDEINEFDTHVKDLRASCDRLFSLWIVHHENKAGDVSGAWERYPDTLVHVQAQGNGRTRIHWRKVRWSSSLHGTSSNLVWAEGAGFEIEEKLAPRDVPSAILEHLARTPGMHTAKEIAEAIEVRYETVREHISRLSTREKIVLTIGPPGRKQNARCWSLSGTDPAVPDIWEHQGTALPF